MATNFPGTSIDSYTTKTDGSDYPQAAHINNPQDAIVALETKVGINSSADNTSIDYKLSTVATGQKSRPVGEISMYGAVAAPTGWLLCDGAAVSRTTYAALFAVISTTFGVGDNSTTFNVPNLKSSFPAGYNSGDANFNAMAKTGGEATHVLTSAEMPVHTHTGNTGGRSADHTHTVGWKANNNSGSATIRGGDGTANTSTTSSGASADHTHGFTTDNTGSGGAHNNLPTYLTVQYIIKY
jgi:microcystin-dependent protein